MASPPPAPSTLPFCQPGQHPPRPAAIQPPPHPAATSSVTELMRSACAHILSTNVSDGPGSLHNARQLSEDDVRRQGPSTFVTIGATQERLYTFAEVVAIIRTIIPKAVQNQGRSSAPARSAPPRPPRPEYSPTNYTSGGITGCDNPAAIAAAVAVARAAADAALGRPPPPPPPAPATINPLIASSAPSGGGVALGRAYQYPPTVAQAAAALTSSSAVRASGTATRRTSAVVGRDAASTPAKRQRTLQDAIGVTNPRKPNPPAPPRTFGAFRQTPASGRSPTILPSHGNAHQDLHLAPPSFSLPAPSPPSAPTPPSSSPPAPPSSSPPAPSPLSAPTPPSSSPPAPPSSSSPPAPPSSKVQASPSVHCLSLREDPILQAAFKCSDAKWKVFLSRAMALFEAKKGNTRTLLTSVKAIRDLDREKAVFGQYAKLVSKLWVLVFKNTAP